jgi:hypothetical protein
MKTDNPRAIAEISIDTQMLVAFLKDRQEASYEELSAVIQRDVRATGPAYGNLASARRILRRDHRILFSTVPKVGLRRADSDLVLKEGRSSIEKIHRESRRGAEKLVCADFESMTNEQKVKHNASAAALGALHAITKGTSIKKLEGATESAKQQLPLAATLEAFVK